MKSFEVRRSIATSPEAVWAQLTNARALVAGGLGLVRLDGTIELGGRLRVVSEANPGRTFALRVSELVPHQRMVWEGGMPLGLFRGVRQFNLTKTAAGTDFHMREDFTGVLAGLIGKSIPDLTPSFEKFADGLRTLAERTRR